MKKVLFLMALAVAQAVGAQQLANGTFDAAWVNCTPWVKGSTVSGDFGKQPEGWCISNVAGMKLVAAWLGTTIVGSEGVGHLNSAKSVVITNTANPLSSSQIVPGYFTLGTTWATAQATITGTVTTGTADGGSFGGVPFTSRPDALRFYYKRAHNVNNKTGNTVNASEKASVIAYMWTGTYTQTSVPAETSMSSPGTVTMIDRDNHILGKEYITGGAQSQSEDAALIASIEYYIEGNQTDWGELTLPFDYGDNYDGTRPAKLNIIFAANDYFAERSGIGVGNQLTVDDVELVYYHSLTSLSYAGSPISGFSETTYDYDLSSVEYDATADISYTVKGVAAQVSSPSYDETTGILTITVTGDDGNATDYRIQFKTISGPAIEDTFYYNEKLLVKVVDAVDGTVQKSDPQNAEVTVEKLETGNINFFLKNFFMGFQGVGNISILDIEVDSEGNFSYSGNLDISNGDDPDVFWLGPFISPVPLEMTGRMIDENTLLVYIYIDMSDPESLQQNIYVHYGYEEATMAVNTDAQYGTFCAPFAVTIPSGVQAYTVPSVTGDVLNLNELTGTIPANTPVVLYAEDGLESMDIYGLLEEGTPTVGLLTGVYEDTSAPVGSYVLQNQGGKVGFYHVEGTQPTVGANRCYLTTSSGIKAFFFDEDDATPIKAIDNAQQSAEGAIYNLSGQRMSKMQKGLNIINGKKILK